MHEQKVTKLGESHKGKKMTDGECRAILRAARLAASDTNMRLFREAQA